MNENAWLRISLVSRVWGIVLRCLRWCGVCHNIIRTLDEVPLPIVGATTLLLVRDLANRSSEATESFINVWKNKNKLQSVRIRLRAFCSADHGNRLFEMQLALEWSEYKKNVDEVMGKIYYGVHRYALTPFKTRWLTVRSWMRQKFRTKMRCMYVCMYCMYLSGHHIHSYTLESFASSSHKTLVIERHKKEKKIAFTYVNAMENNRLLYIYRLSRIYNDVATERSHCRYPKNIH